MYTLAGAAVNLGFLQQGWGHRRRGSEHAAARLPSQAATGQTATHHGSGGGGGGGRRRAVTALQELQACPAHPTLLLGRGPDAAATQALTLETAAADGGGASVQVAARGWRAEKCRGRACRQSLCSRASGAAPIGVAAAAAPPRCALAPCISALGSLQWAYDASLRGGIQASPHGQGQGRPGCVLGIRHSLTPARLSLLLPGLAEQEQAALHRTSMHAAPRSELCTFHSRRRRRHCRRLMKCSTAPPLPSRCSWRRRRRPPLAPHLAQEGAAGAPAAAP